MTFTTTRETEIIECDCEVCHGRRARTVKLGSMSASDRRTTIHNLIGIAQSPFAQAESVKQNGPWAI